MCVHSVCRQFEGNQKVITIPIFYTPNHEKCVNVVHCCCCGCCFCCYCTSECAKAVRFKCILLYLVQQYGYSTLLLLNVVFNIIKMRFFMWLVCAGSGCLLLLLLYKELNHKTCLECSHFGALNLKKKIYFNTIDRKRVGKKKK